jgi:exodeoxyribonuclease VII small subunit
VIGTMAGKAEGTGGTGGEPKFEEALAELEAVVRRLEQGELPLEDSLAAFERGMALVKQLSTRLEAIERRVEVLLKQDDGSLIARPLDDDET